MGRVLVLGVMVGCGPKSESRPPATVPSSDGGPSGKSANSSSTKGAPSEIEVLPENLTADDIAPVLARLVFLGPEVAAPLLFGAIAFGMPIRGGVVSIALVAILGALMWGALGLLMGSRARTFEAASGLMNMMSVPMWVLSGVFFAASNFPEAVQPFIQLLPLTALVDALRAVVLEGASFASIWHELAIMAGWTIVPFAIALRIFRWR